MDSSLIVGALLGAVIIGFLLFIRSQRSILHLMMGMVMFQLTGTGVMSFIASVLIRSHGFNLVGAGTLIAFGYGAGNIVGMIGGGVLADRLGSRDVRWRARIGLISACSACFCLSILLVSADKQVIAAWFFGWAFSCGLFAPPTYALFQSLVRPRMRATVSSVQNVVGYAIGGSLGPLIVGLVSNHFTETLGADALRHALMSMIPFYLWGAVHYFLAERTLESDLQRASALATGRPGFIARQPHPV